MLLAEHVSPQVPEQSRNTLQITSGLIEKSRQRGQALGQRLRPCGHCLGQTDTNDGEIKGRLGLVHPGMGELIRERPQDPLEHVRVNGPGR